MAEAIPFFSTAPVYKAFEAELRADILNGRLAPGSRICSETVLAERYSISRGSVRTALDNLVRDNLLRKVRGSGTFVTAPEDRNIASVFHRQIVFLSFATALSHNVFYDSPTYIPMMKGMTDICSRNGYNLLVSHVGMDWQPPPCICDKDVSGILFHGPVQKEFYNQWIAPFPNVSVVYQHPYVDGYCITEDTKSFSFQAVEQLKLAGYRRIGFLTNEIDMPIPLERYYAYQMALHELGLPFEPRYSAIWQRPFSNGILEKEYGIPDYQPHLAPMFSDPSLEPPDAFICMDDWRAYGAIITLKRLGLKVPEDIGIIGGTNDGISCQYEVPISGMNTRLDTICEKAVELLLHVINGKQNEGITVQIRPHFVRGATLRSAKHSLIKNGKGD